LDRVARIRTARPEGDGLDDDFSPSGRGERIVLVSQKKRNSRERFYGILMTFWRRGLPCPICGDADLWNVATANGGAQVEFVHLGISGNYKRCCADFPAKNASLRADQLAALLETSKLINGIAGGPPVCQGSPNCVFEKGQWFHKPGECAEFDPYAD
jgi:hypothetical protein